MWKALIDLLAEQVRKRPQRQLLKAMLQLHDAMLRCHLAYLRIAALGDKVPFHIDTDWRKGPPDLIREWESALKELIRTTWGLRYELQIVAPSVAAHLAKYIEVEVGSLIQPEELRHWEGTNLAEREMYGRFVLTLVDYSGKGGDFEETIASLRELIRTHFTIEEISSLSSLLESRFPSRGRGRG